MSLPHNQQELGKLSRSKKKRGAVFIVIVISIVVHVVGLGGLAAIKIIEVLQPEPEFEAPPVETVKTPPPPPPPPPTTKRAQRSMPRPQPLAAQNPQNMSVPAIEINNSNLTIGGGRGFGGGLGELGGAVSESIRITSFGFDRAMEGTLEGTLYDLKRSPSGQDLLKEQNKKQYGAEIIKRFSNSFNYSHLNGKYIKSDTLLYGAYFVIPSTRAEAAPRAFKAEGKMKPNLLCAVYSGSYRPKKNGRFRLAGRGDDVLLVRINGRMVLDGSWIKNFYSRWKQSNAVERHDQDNPQVYFGIKKPMITGSWFDLRKDVETQIEVLISEVPGGLFGAYILIEEEGIPGKQFFTTRPLSDKDKAFLRKSHPDAPQFIQ